MGGAADTVRPMRLPTPPPAPAPRPFWVVGALLLATDAVLVALFAAHKLGWVHDPALLLGRDGGTAETVQYAKTLWVGLCALGLAARTRQPVYAALGALFLGLLADDAGQLHEFWGARLADGLALPAVAGLRPSDLGEVLFLALWVGPVFGAGVAGYRRSDRAARHAARWALGALAALAAFGVGADAVHQAATAAVEVPGLHSLLTLIEEGGELAVMSALAAAAVAAAVGDLPAPPARGAGRWRAPDWRRRAAPPERVAA